MKLHKILKMDINKNIPCQNLECDLPHGIYIKVIRYITVFSR